jgi:hypothetical protein
MRNSPDELPPCRETQLNTSFDVVCAFKGAMDSEVAICQRTPKFHQRKNLQRHNHKSGVIL